MADAVEGDSTNYEGHHVAAPSADSRRKNGSPAPHGNTEMELVNVHLQLWTQSRASVDEHPVARDDAHLERHSATREDTSGHPVDPNVEKGLSRHARQSEVACSAARLRLSSLRSHLWAMSASHPAEEFREFGETE